ncbi:UBX domain-containing protein 1 [Eumeta japonica]|uniref:UBX domain-containing protein 1 n=1 Tax=Eumeta variegata TaxID=151549 RepID=A0A4C1S809_EUMVA|nr:UBX domain-containing protein 1 [Eumeta japonica]
MRDILKTPMNGYGEKALAITNNKGVEPAMEWLLAHADDPEVDVAQVVDSSAESSSAPVAGSSSDPAQAKSFKCDECGKLFKDQDEMEYHAAKTNHSSFSESTEEKKPLTEEEKRAQLALLEERMKQKRKEREEREKAEALERERLRIKSGKDLQDAKLRLQEQEMKKLVEQRRRDKIEDQKARERVKAQIEADRQARKLAVTGEKPPTPAPAPPPINSNPTPKISYDQARIQLRLPDGRTLSQTFGAKEQLAAVRLYLQMNATEFSQEGSFKLMTTFPKKIFTEDDFEKPLELLDSSTRGVAGTYVEQTEKIIVLPGLAILAPPSVYALCLGTGGRALFTALFED